MTLSTIASHISLTDRVIVGSALVFFISLASYAGLMGKSWLFGALVIAVASLGYIYRYEIYLMWLMATS